MAPRSDPLKLRERMVELRNDGYIKFLSPGKLLLTERGLAVLMACADRSQTKAQLKKPSLASERMWTHAERSRQITNRDNSERGHEDA